MSPTTITVAEQVTVTIPRDVAAVFALLALGGFYWYVVSVREWIRELITSWRRPKDDRRAA